MTHQNLPAFTGQLTQGQGETKKVARELYEIVERLVNYKESENAGVYLVDNDRFFDDAMSALQNAKDVL